MKLSKKISDWIKKQVKEAGKKGVVLGLSGGLDSALVAALSAKAVGKKKVLGLIMPCGSCRKDERDAIKVAKHLGIKTVKLKLDTVYNVFLRILPKSDKMGLANLKPRLRMSSLYYYAHKNKYLVAGTGNKSELTVGYFTKYGDGGVDILPIGSLFKTDVRELALDLGIPQVIIDRHPSAGLWADQTDEAEMGISYEELDKIIRAIEKKKTKGINKEKLRKVKKMMSISDHKRVSVPVCKK